MINSTNTKDTSPETAEVLPVEETNWSDLEKELPTNITEDDITSFLDGIDE